MADTGRMLAAGIPLVVAIDSLVVAIAATSAALAVFDLEAVRISPVGVSGLSSLVVQVVYRKARNCRVE